MALSLSQAVILSEFLKDPDGRVALVTFLDEQRRYYESLCTRQMLTGDTLNATKNAHYSNVYSEVMANLDAFVKKQVQPEPTR